MNAYFAIDRQYEIDCMAAADYESWEENQDLAELAEFVDVSSLIFAVMNHDKELLNSLSLTLNEQMQKRWQAYLKDCEDSKWDGAIDDYDMAGCF